MAHSAGGLLSIHLRFLTYQKNLILWGAARSPLKNAHFYRHPCIAIIKEEAIFLRKKSYSIPLSQQDKVPYTLYYSNNVYYTSFFISGT